MRAMAPNERISLRMRLLLGVVLLSFTSAVGAVVIVPGLSFTVADDDNRVLGVHFHPVFDDAPGLPRLAEVGGFLGIEEVRGLAEFEVAGIVAGKKAFVRFDVALILPTTRDPLGTDDIVHFDIDVLAYRANHQKDLDDYFSGDELLTTFNTADVSVGDALRIDVTRQIDDQPLGIALRQATPNPDGSVAFFNLFELVQVTAPSPLALLCLGAGFALAVRRLRWRDA